MEEIHLVQLQLESMKKGAVGGEINNFRSKKCFCTQPRGDGKIEGIHRELLLVQQLYLFWQTMNFVKVRQCGLHGFDRGCVMRAKPEVRAAFVSQCAAAAQSETSRCGV